VIELISILASLAVIILTPIQTAQIRAGRRSKRFQGTPEQYVQSYRKQMMLLVWLGLIFGALNIGLIFVETRAGEWIVKLVAAALWFGVCVVSFLSRQKLAELPAAATRG